MPEKVWSSRTNAPRLGNATASQVTEVAFFLLLAHFAVLWSAFLLLFDYFICFRDALEQSRTFGFVAVGGTVVKSAAKTEKDEDGATYWAVDLAYSYRVDDRDYQGSRLRYLDYWTNLRVSEIVAAHPPGSAVTVYCDPADPARAVLEAGFDGRELLLALLLLPFHAVAFGLLSVTVAGFQNGCKGWSKLYTGVRRIEAAGEVRVRIPGTAPAAAGLLALIILPIPVALGVGLSAGVPTKLETAAGAWLVVLATFFVVYIRYTRRAASGKYDLVIDDADKTLTLPQELTGSETVVIRREDLQEVALVTKLEPEHGRLYSVAFRWRPGDGGLAERNLKNWFALEEAEQLVRWVQAAAGLSQAPAGGQA
jgi:hypothetical protein